MGTYYFASDFHLGAPTPDESLVREKKVVRWLDEVRSDADEIFILGDVFDFWFEYKSVVPRGHVRLLGKLAEITDAGTPIHLFTGNHDMWIFDYLPRETGVVIHRDPVVRNLNGKQCLIGHGDGLGPGDHGYKFIKKVFRSPISRWLFARLHPNFGIGLANYFSGKSRAATGDSDKNFLGKDGEWLATYAEEFVHDPPIDYFIFGHRHLPMHIKLDSGAEYFNLGDWIHHFSYGVLRKEQFEIKGYGTDPKVYSNTD